MVEAPRHAPHARGALFVCVQWDDSLVCGFVGKFKERPPRCSMFLMDARPILGSMSVDYLGRRLFVVVLLASVKLLGNL